jgi:hypothetical protein
MSKAEQACRKVALAIREAGPNPSYHRAQVDRLMRDWPTLWEAIQECRVVNSELERGGHAP